MECPTGPPPGALRVPYPIAEEDNPELYEVRARKAAPRRPTFPPPVAHPPPAQTSNSLRRRLPQTHPPPSSLHPLQPQGDDFRIWCMKILPCSKRFVHDWAVCPFAHAGEKAVRRDPRLADYTGIACPDMKRTGACIRGDRCPYAHNVFEYWLHPTRYRTQLCNDGPACRRAICFFAHSLAQLRAPAVKPHVSPEALARTSLDAIHANPHPLGQQLSGGGSSSGGRGSGGMGGMGGSAGYSHSPSAATPLYGSHPSHFAGFHAHAAQQAALASMSVGFSGAGSAPGGAGGAGLGGYDGAADHGAPPPHGAHVRGSQPPRMSSDYSPLPRWSIDSAAPARASFGAASETRPSYGAGEARISYGGGGAERFSYGGGGGKRAPYGGGAAGEPRLSFTGERPSFGANDRAGPPSSSFGAGERVSYGERAAAYGASSLGAERLSLGGELSPLDRQLAGLDAPAGEGGGARPPPRARSSLDEQLASAEREHATLRADAPAGAGGGAFGGGGGAHLRSALYAGAPDFAPRAGAGMVRSTSASRLAAFPSAGRLSSAHPSAARLSGGRPPSGGSKRGSDANLAAPSGGSPPEGEGSLAHSLAALKIAATAAHVRAGAASNHDAVISTLHAILRGAADNKAAGAGGLGCEASSGGGDAEVATPNSVASAAASAAAADESARASLEEAAAGEAEAAGCGAIPESLFEALHS
jgi:hypothetical protein